MYLAPFKRYKNNEAQIKLKYIACGILFEYAQYEDMHEWGKEREREKHSEFMHFDRQMLKPKSWIVFMVALTAAAATAAKPASTRLQYECACAHRLCDDDVHR